MIYISRKKEIGILLSIGKSKANIILQIFTETFLVAVISFVAAIPFSNLIAEKVGVFLVSRVTTGTVNFNVQIDAATEDELINAAKIVNVYEFVQNFIL